MLKYRLKITRLHLKHLLGGFLIESRLLVVVLVPVGDDVPAAVGARHGRAAEPLPPGADPVGNIPHVGPVSCPDKTGRQMRVRRRHAEHAPLIVDEDGGLARPRLAAGAVPRAGAVRRLAAVVGVARVPQHHPAATQRAQLGDATSHINGTYYTARMVEHHKRLEQSCTTAPISVETILNSNAVTQMRHEVLELSRRPPQSVDRGITSLSHARLVLVRLVNAKPIVDVRGITGRGMAFYCL
ncbi:hypothetical protein EVAR_17967_1 [Eumeta japonica]|uniref:Uncharacterized protein n=1 Tax=Eumeta variegata TaxID=151549 RepID=A0A4C1UZM9_EUMVA|nr:hypothetical protein EVAR_17967_1 [Eumeta japonica]